MLVLLWEKSLHWFYNNIGVLEVRLIYMVNCYKHVEKQYRIMRFSCTLRMKLSL